MGRYFLYRMHPFSVAELITTDLPSESLIRPPSSIGSDAWHALSTFGGFPEPMLSASDRFSRRWQRMRHAQLFKEDVRDLTRIQDVALVEVMGLLLKERSGQQFNISNLARDVGIAPSRAKAWVETLCALHVGFLVRPWFRNISSALRKEAKWFLRDWSGIEDVGQRAETFVACHLLKAVEGWTDLGLGVFDLRYVRDKRKREVDFLIVRDCEPWILVEVKASDTRLSPHLALYQQQTGAVHALQVVLDLPYVDADCFTRRTPQIVPARTFLSQLL